MDFPKILKPVFGEDATVSSPSKEGFSVLLEAKINALAPPNNKTLNILSVFEKIRNRFN